MYAEERKAAIVGLARTEGRVEVAQLAQTLDVTPETVRRDLTALQRHGLLRRVHGGAILPDGGALETDLAVRESVMVEEKARIARAALAWLPERGAIALDGGSTTHRLARSCRATARSPSSPTTWPSPCAWPTAGTSQSMSSAGGCGAAPSRPWTRSRWRTCAASTSTWSSSAPTASRSCAA